MPRFEITVEYNRASGTRTYAVEADDANTALREYEEFGEVVFDDIYLSWDCTYDGGQPDPEVCKADDYANK